VTSLDIDKRGQTPPLIFTHQRGDLEIREIEPKELDKRVVYSPLKWAGGKRWIARELRAILPRKFDWYFEPFAGGASIFFFLAPKKAALADLNADLIATYQAIKDDVKGVWKELDVHAQNHSDSYYYSVRANRPTALSTRAARFLYLNRTCWNGLFRVNQNGEFNVPRGTKNEVLLSTDTPLLFARTLQNAELLWADFEMLVDGASHGDIVYADPPYTVKHNLNGFVKYNESIFSWADQERLAKSIRRARKRGAFVIVSNADHPSIRELYKGDFKLQTVKRNSVIAGSAKFRSLTTELLIVGEPTRAVVSMPIPIPMT
jgi:DNA adenine methylase